MSYKIDTNYVFQTYPSSDTNKEENREQIVTKFYTLFFFPKNRQSDII